MRGVSYLLLLTVLGSAWWLPALRSAPFGQFCAQAVEERSCSAGGCCMMVCEAEEPVPSGTKEEEGPPCCAWMACCQPAIGLPMSRVTLVVPARLLLMVAAPDVPCVVSSFASSVWHPPNA